MLTAHRLRELISYDPETGVITSRKTGKPQTRHTKKGYCRVPIDGRNYQAHRLAWLYVTGSPLPAEMQIDHINGVRDDNRWVNLRAATQSQNARNCGAYRSRKYGRLKGAYYLRRPNTLFCWRSLFYLNGKLIHLGVFETEREAHEAYMDEARKHFGEFASAGHPPPRTMTDGS